MLSAQQSTDLAAATASEVELRTEEELKEWREMVDPIQCCIEGHLTVLTVGWWFGKRYWLRCWRCKLRTGPWRSREVAEQYRKTFDGPSPLIEVVIERVKKEIRTTRKRRPPTTN